VDESKHTPVARVAEVHMSRYTIEWTNGALPEGTDLYAPDLAAEVERLRQEKDGAYEERNRVVAAFARAAVSLGWPVAVTRTAIEGWSEDWHGCIYIVTPAGQASWHFHDSHAHLFADLPRGAMAWDGHTTPEKYERLHGMRLAENAELRRKVEALREALNAMLTHMGMDEDEWNKPTFDQARAALAASDPQRGSEAQG